MMKLKWLVPFIDSGTGKHRVCQNSDFPTDGGIFSIPDDRLYIYLDDLIATGKKLVDEVPVYNAAGVSWGMAPREEIAMVDIVSLLAGCDGFDAFYYEGVPFVKLRPPLGSVEGRVSSNPLAVYVKGDEVGLPDGGVYSLPHIARYKAKHTNHSYMMKSALDNLESSTGVKLIRTDGEVITVVPRYAMLADNTMVVRPYLNTITTLGVQLADHLVRKIDLTDESDSDYIPTYTLGQLDRPALRQRADYNNEVTLAMLDVALKGIGDAPLPPREVPKVTGPQLIGEFPPMPSSEPPKPAVTQEPVELDRGDKEEFSGGFVDYYRTKVDFRSRGGLPQEVECEDLIIALDLKPQEANIFKELWRNAMRRKGLHKKGHNAIYAYEKIRHYSNLLHAMEVHKNGNKNSNDGDRRL